LEKILKIMTQTNYEEDFQICPGLQA